jgi:hypothetical protein
MVLKIHQPEAAMSEHIIRIGNIDRSTSWITFYFESEDDASQAAALLKEALQNAIKVEWP